MKSLIGLIFGLVLSISAQANHDSTDWIEADLLEIDIEELTEGKPETFVWAKLPIKVLKPTEQQAKALSSIPQTMLGDATDTFSLQQTINQVYRQGYEKLFFHNFMLNKRNQENVIVLIGLSPYIGCSPYFNKDWGNKNRPKELAEFFFDPCRDVFFDISGRVVKGHKHKSQLNMPVPPYIVKDNIIIVGNTFGLIKADIKNQIAGISENYRTITNDNQLYDAIGHNRVDEIKAYLNESKLDLSKLSFSGITVLAEAIIQDHLKLVELFLKYGSSFNELLPGGDKLGCVLQYKSAEELELYYKLGLEPKQGYCNNHEGCFLPLILQTAAIQPIQEEEKRIKLAIKYGFDVDKQYCGVSLRKALLGSQRSYLLELNQK